MTWIVLCHFTYEIIGHINRLDYPAKGIKINLLFHMCTEQVTHTCFLEWSRLTWEHVTVWFGAIPMQLCFIPCAILTDDQQTFNGGWWRLVTINLQNNTHSLSHKLKGTHIHTSKKKTWPSVHFKQQSICEVSKNKNTNHLERWHLP